MRGFFSIFLISIFLLSSCGQGEENTVLSNSGGKVPFYVKIATNTTSGTVLSFEKTGRIVASSSLTLTAQGAGEIQKISAKEGQYVKAGTIIATLKDTQNNYDLKYTQAQNTLKIQSATIETTRINLEQSVENARIAYERARQAYETLTGKNALTYDTLVNSNNKTLDAYNENYKSYLSDTERLMTQLLYEGDKILGMTTNYQYSNDAWEPYLGAQIGNSRAEAGNKWNETYSMRGDIRAKIEKTKNIDPNNIQGDLDIITKAHNQLQSYADAMLNMLQNNTVGAGLSGEMNTAWNTAWSGYRGSVQSSQSTYNAWKGQTTTFFKGYKNTELANKLALESLSRTLTPEEQNTINGSSDIRISYETAKIDFKDKIRNAELSLEQAKKAYETAMALKDATIVQLEANSENAKIALSQAERDYNKLRIIAPVDGIISKVIGNIGQSVNNGGPIVEFTGKQPQMILDIDPMLAGSLTVGQSVTVTVDEKALTGTITAVSSVSNANLLSTIRIAVENATSFIGQSATVSIREIGNQSGRGGMLRIALSAIKIINENEGEIYVLSGETTPIRKGVKIGGIYGNEGVIMEGISPNEKVILTPLDNYNPEKHTITIQ